jgi:hypothetical protein
MDRKYQGLDGWGAEIRTPDPPKKIKLTKGFCQRKKYLAQRFELPTPKKNKSKPRDFGRGGEIRTPDPLVPNQVR